MYWLSGVVLVVLSFCARVNSGAVSAIAEKCKAAGSKKIVLCSAIGFSGTDGNAVYESVFGEGFGDQIVIARDELDLDNGNSDIAVAMVKIVELNGDLNGLQVAMQNSMEAAMYRGQTTKLIVILSGTYILDLIVADRNPQ